MNVFAPASPKDTVYKLGDHIFGVLAQNGRQYNKELFRALTKIAYSKHRDVHRALRFGAAIEWPAHSLPALKCYFDLHSDGRDLAATRLAASFCCLGLEPQLSRARELLGRRFEDARCRGMAVDFAVSGFRGIRIYTPGTRWSLEELRELLVATERSDQLELLDFFNASVLGGLSPHEPVRHLLVSLAFTSLSETEPILKLDAFLPALKPDDLASYEACSSLAERLTISSEDVARAFSIVIGPDGPSQTQRIMQYLSVDFLSASKSKLNGYFRLPGTETEHLRPQFRPRRKTRLLWRLDEACRSAIRALERERSTQYHEAVHRMVFPRASGFSSVQELQLGEVFQRALIIDALLDAAGSGYFIDRRGLDDDVALLVDMRSADGLGGWKYFPSLPELPPDVDDLAQVMQVLQRSQLLNFTELVEPLLKVIEKSQRADGSFETWIVSDDDESPIAARARSFIDTHWGAGANAEVIANMLYAMWLYDSRRYENLIDCAIQYLASCQLPDGSWTAAWYAGSYYSTFVCVRALQVANSSHYALYRAGEFLRKMQNATGSWGSGAPNSGDTAYALRTACVLANETARPMIVSGCDFLLRNQDSGGFWPSSDFITMNTSRANSESKGRLFVYRSKTITTAACLSALCAARQFVDSE